MKRTLLILVLTLVFADFIKSQCTPNCYNYAVLPITYSLFPTAGTNAIPQFAPNPDDGYTPPVALGFNFNFYCTTYSNVLVYSNGLLQFNIGQPSTFPSGYDAAQYIPSVSLPTILNGIVALRMDDLDPGVGGSVTYTTIGTAPNRMFVLTYSAVPIFTVTPPSLLLNSGQIVLYETSNIIDIYTIDSPQSPNLATQGVESASGMTATAVPGRNQSLWSATNSAYRFFPVSPAPPVPVGATSICSGVQSTYSVGTQPGSTSYNWNFPAGWTGTGTTSAISTTAGIAGSVSVSTTYTCGISAQATLSVNVIPAPVVSVVSVDPPVVCSGAEFTITPAGGLNYTLSPGGATTNSVFILNAGNINSYSIVTADANCMSANTAVAGIVVNPSPTISVNSGTICEGGQFTITPTGADSYPAPLFLIVSPPVGTHTYAVIGKDNTNGCFSTPVVSSLIVNANPVITLTSVRSFICKGESEKLIAGGASTYSWSTGATSGSTIVVTPSVSASYTVTGTTAEGCSKIKTISLAVTACTGVEDVNLMSSNMVIYPNPSSGVYNIDFGTSVVDANVEIFDVTGRKVMSIKTDKFNESIDMSAQTNGLYYVKIKNGDVNETFKIIKQ